MGYLGQKYDKGIVIQRSPEGSAFQEEVNVVADGDTEVTPKVGGGLKKVNITGAGGTEVIANPELEGNEDDLNSIEIAGVKYVIPGGGSAGDSVINTDFVFELQQGTNDVCLTGPDDEDKTPTNLQEWANLLASGFYFYIVDVIKLTANGEDVLNSYLTYEEFTGDDESGYNIYLATPYGEIGIYAYQISGDENMYYNIDWTRYRTPSFMHLRLMYNVSDNGVIDELLDTYSAMLDYNVNEYTFYNNELEISGYGGQDAYILEYCNIWVTPDGSEDNYHAWILTSKGEIEIILSVDAETGDTTFNINWENFGSTGGGTSTSVHSYYVGVSHGGDPELQVQAIPVLKYVLTEDGYGPEEFGVDEFYQMMQERYANIVSNGQANGQPFNLPTYFILNQAQPVTNVSDFWWQGISSNAITLEVVSDQEPEDPIIPPTVVDETDGISWEHYVRVTSLGSYSHVSIKGFIMKIDLDPVE